MKAYELQFVFHADGWFPVHCITTLLKNGKLKKPTQSQQAYASLGTASHAHDPEHDYLEQAEDIRHSPLGKATYALRSQTIERVFADAKEKHAMRYTPYRGLPAVTAWVKLKFTALNLKKLAIHKWMRLLVSSILHMIKATLLHGKVASLTV